MYKILVVDDDFEILKLMTNIFEMQNYAVTTYQVVNSPIDIDDFMGFDLILLDVMMPNVDGMALCQEIRHRIATPIIFVSAKDSEEDIISGLKLGGDDYITKPFSIKQLVAKVEAHLKREERLKQAKKDFQEFKREFSTMTFYLQEKSIYINGERVPLTSREYRILELLSSQPKKKFLHVKISTKAYITMIRILFLDLFQNMFIKFVKNFLSMTLIL